jgi:AhpC/TSA family
MKCSDLIPAVAILIGSLAAAVFAQQTQDAGSKSTVDAIHKLVHAGRFDEVMAKVNSLPLNDPVWKNLLDVLIEAAEQRNDYSYLENKAEQVMNRGRDSETRAVAAFALGVGYWKSGHLDDAVTAFSQVSRIAPGSELAFNAQGNIHEIKDLGIGRPAPHFAAQTSSGERLDSNDFRGKVVLVNFWASW